MKKSSRAELGIASLGAMLLLSLLPPSPVAAADDVGTSTATSGNVATRWMERTLSAVRSGNPAIHTSTPGAGRTYAMTTAAMYDALNGIEVADGVSTRDRALLPSYDDAPAGASVEAAVSGAAHGVLTSLFASNSTVRGSLDAALADELAALGSDPGVESGLRWGADVAISILSLRSSDGTQSPSSLEGRSSPGAFPRVFSGTQFRNMTPFGVDSITPYLSSGPPPLTSAEYAEDFNEVKALGSFTDADAERTAITRHWLAEGGTVRETGLWLKAALNVIDEQGTDESLSDTTRVFALLGMGIGDAVATSWSDKHRWHFWRPGDAIRHAATDGNPATEADPNWSPRNGVCTNANTALCGVFGGTPEHTSGTSMFAGAAATILGGFYCTDRVSFTFVGEQPHSAPRSYDSFSEGAREAGRSRIFGGIHFQFSNEAGRQAGKEIGRDILRTRLLPAGSKPTGADCTADS